jgi:F0F1-type ATP synthase assembly protein I
MEEKELVAIAVIVIVVGLCVELVQRSAKHGVVGWISSLSPETRRKAQAAYKILVRLVSVFLFFLFGWFVRELFTFRASGGPSIWALIWMGMLIFCAGVALVGGLRSLVWGSREIQKISAIDETAASPEKE